MFTMDRKKIKQYYMCRLYWKKNTQDRQEKIESQRY